jgi:hypothetical protein
VRFFGVGVCWVGLSLVLACGEPHILYSETVSDKNPAPESVGGPPRVCLRIGKVFSAPDQDKILAAVASENLYANTRFDFAPETADSAKPGSWTLLMERGEPARVTRQFPEGGGVIVLDANRLKAGDLRKAIADAGGFDSGVDLRCSADTPAPPGAPPHSQTSHAAPG